MRPRRINSKEIYRGGFIFRQNTVSHPSLGKVFFLKKCMNGGGDWKCGSHVLLTRLHNPSHDSRSGEVQPILVFKTYTETLSHIGELLTSTQMLPDDDCTASVFHMVNTVTKDSTNYLVCCFFISLFVLFSHSLLLCCS